MNTFRYLQVRICTRMGVKLVSTPFEDKSYYTNIRKAVTAGYFMQVIRGFAWQMKRCHPQLTETHSRLGCASGTCWAVPDRQGQPAGVPAPLDVPRPQARVVSWKKKLRSAIQGYFTATSHAAAAGCSIKSLC